MPKAASKKTKGRKRVTKTAVTKNQLGRMVRSYVTNIEEKKYIQFCCTSSTWNTGTATNATWTFGSAIQGGQNAVLGAMVGVIQGTNRNERVGNRIRLHRIDFLINIVPISGPTMFDGSICRVVVYHNKEPQGSLVTSAQTFASDIYNAPRNEQYRNRISILKDFTHSMVATGTNAGAVLSTGPQFLGKFSIYPKQVVEYSGSTGTIATIMKHDYGVGWCSDTTSCCNITCVGTVVYTDV